MPYTNSSANDPDGGAVTAAAVTKVPVATTANVTYRKPPPTPYPHPTTTTTTTYDDDDSESKTSTGGLLLYKPPTNNNKCSSSGNLKVGNDGEPTEISPPCADPRGIVIATMGCSNRSLTFNNGKKG